MEDLKRDMAVLATSGRDWADRTRRLAAKVPDLPSGGWKITAKGRAVLDVMEARPTASETAHVPAVRLRQPADRAKRRRERRREARGRARANAS